MKQISCHYCNAVYAEYQTNCDQCGANLHIPDSSEGKSKIRIWLESLSNRGFITLSLFVVLVIFLLYFTLVPKNSFISQYQNYLLQKSLGNVLSVASRYKLIVSDYYATMGKFPDSLAMLEEDTGKLGTEDEEVFKKLTILKGGKIRLDVEKPYETSSYKVTLTPEAKENGSFYWKCQTSLSLEQIGKKNLEQCLSTATRKG